MTQTLRVAHKPTTSSRHHHACPSRPPATLGSYWFRTARLAVAALMLLAPLFAQAAIIYVDGSAGGANDGSSWADAYTDLQDALGEAASGDEIRVAAGVYKPVVPADVDNVTNAERREAFQLISGVEIYGGFPHGGGDQTSRDWQSHLTILSGDIDGNDTTNSDGVVVDHTDTGESNSLNVVTGSDLNDSTTFDGFVVTGGYAGGTEDVNERFGGGIRISQSSPVISNLRVIGNFAENRGGGMVVESSSDAIIEALEFTGNRGQTNGGGLSVEEQSEAIVRASTFADNVSGQGGGAYLSDGTSHVQDVVFINNHAISGGGAMAGAFGHSTFTNVTFVGNLADNQGGGLAIFELADSLTLINAAFLGNSTNGRGGGIHDDTDVDLTMTNVVVSGNRAGDAGGGIYNTNRSGFATFENSIFWNNQADGQTDSVSASVANEDVDSSAVAFEYSLVENCNPTGTWDSACGTDDGNNLEDGDPLFVNTPNPAIAPATAGNLRLQSGSPAIDSGDNADNDTNADIIGNARIINSTIDLGAFETADSTCPSDGVRFVDRNATQPRDGLSWDSAYGDLQDALAVTEPCEIWVASGTYKPTDDATDQAATFQLKNDVGIYGGFDGTETERDQRNPKARITVLSGDIDDNDTTNSDGVVVDPADMAGSNSYHVTIGSGTDGTAILDGFTITAGSANGSSDEEEFGGGMFNDSGSPNLANLSFNGNSAGSWGGGMGNFDSSPELTNVIFSGNSSDLHGGGMYNLDGSNAILTNVSFSGNNAVDNDAGNGGGMFNRESSPELTNVTFSANNAGNDGGGMFSHSSSAPDIRNTIFWNNQDSSGTGTAAASIDNGSGGTPTISYSMVQGCNPGDSWNSACGTDGGENLTDSNPLFVNMPDPNEAPTTAGDLHLQAGSPAIDSGNDDFIEDIDNATDLDGNSRKVGDAVDLGPYEYFERPDLLFNDRFETID